MWYCYSSAARENWHASLCHGVELGVEGMQKATASIIDKVRASNKFIFFLNDIADAVG